MDVICDLSKYDPIQISLMEEVCILVDSDDKVIGNASKKDTHLMENINKGMLHRAFSVFLFNEKGELLLQQRSETKITFPTRWTNTCCSHPLSTPLELEDKNQLGIRRAAQRRLYSELGVDPSEISLDDFKFLSRIHYKAPSDKIWGEHEVDYILFIQKDVNVKPNPTEVMDIRYVSQEALKNMIEKSKTDSEIKLTPWFALIADSCLWRWWDSLICGNLDLHVDGMIHHLVEANTTN